MRMPFCRNVFSVGICFVCVFTLSMGCSKEAPKSKAKKVPVINSSSNKTFASLIADFDEANANLDSRKKFAATVLEYADSNVGDNATIEALAWLTRQNRRITGFAEANDLAIDRLIAHYPDAPETTLAVFNMRKARSPRTLETLDRLMRSTNKTLRGMGAYSNGFRNMRTDREKAIKCLNTAINDHADLTFVSDGRTNSVSRLAEAALFEMNQLRVGQEVPEIFGKDLDGQSFKLSDYRGKVVLISFWADW